MNSIRKLCKAVYSGLLWAVNSYFTACSQGFVDEFGFGVIPIHDDKDED